MTFERASERFVTRAKADSSLAAEVRGFAEWFGFPERTAWLWVRDLFRKFDVSSHDEVKQCLWSCDIFPSHSGAERMFRAHDAYKAKHGRSYGQPVETKANGA